MKIRSLLYLLMLVFSVFFIFTACEDKEEIVEIITPEEKSDTQITNEWIYDQMKRVYLWNDKLNPSPNYKDKPEDFFKSILFDYGKVEGDQFSWIEEDRSKKTKSEAVGYLGFTYVPGVYFATIDVEYSSVGLFVTSVKEGSDAEAKGLKRGQIIYRVNEIAITGKNYLNILDENPLIFSIYDNESGERRKLEEIAANASDNSPVILSKLLTENGVNIGYLVYNAFERGIEDATTLKEQFKYDIELLQSIQDLKNKGASEFILDLRYNPGGYLSSAVALASALVPQRTTRKVFLKEEYNPYFQDSLVNIYGQDGLNEYFINKLYETNIDIPNLNLQRLYVIATENSASASEAVIHGLRPYIKDLYHIGLTTVGKDKASITVKSDDKRILWQLQPLVSRLTNSRGDGNYIHGLEPQYEISEWEESFEMVTATNTATGERVSVPLASPWKGGFKPLGDKSEPLLAAAISHISTGAFPEKRTRIKSTQSVTKQVPDIKWDESRFKTIIDSDKFDRLRKK